MTWAQAEKFVEEGSKVLAEYNKKKTNGDKPSADIFVKRTLETVSRSLAQANDGDFTVDKLREEFDMIVLNALYDKVMEISGLKITQGEV